VRREDRFHKHLRKARERRRPGLAPADLVRQDFRQLEQTVTLRTSQLVEDLILMQSVEGHAHEGHSAFRGRRFPNMSMDDTVEALGRDPRVVTAQRQALIDEVAEWVERAIKGEAGEFLVTPEGDPFFDISTLRYIRVEPGEVLRGLYLGGLRDNSDVRLRVEEKYGIRIGGGACYLVDVEVMEAMRLDGEKLAHAEFASRLGEFRQRGLIVDRCRDEADRERCRYLYIRHRLGGGQSDDAAICAGGKLFNRDVALGVFLADAIDTFEKYVPEYSDQDDDLAELIGKQFPGLNISEGELEKVVWVSAASEERKDEVPDSSLRYLLTVDRTCDQTALESHLAYVRGRPYAEMELAFERVPNRVFYEYLDKRLGEFPGA
jgi:hypothetical protein